MENVGDKIYSLRKKKGLSQEELSFELGVSRQTVSKWESNAVQPNLENIKSLCSVFQVTSEFFMQEKLVSEVAADAVAVEVASNESEAEEYIKKKRVKSLYLSVSIILTFFSIVAIVFSIIVGLTAFTSNYGDDIVTSFKYDTWSFVICLVVTIFFITINIFIWIKTISLKRCTV